MSDYSSSLPIRTESDGADEKVVVKIVDGTPGGSNQVSVDSDKNLHVELHGNDAAGVDRVVKTSESGNAAIDGVYHATNNSNPSKIGQIMHVRAATPADSDQSIRRTGIVNGTIHAADVSLFDENGAAFSASNPLPVTIVDSEGAEINDYATSSALAAAASADHDYTVTALKTLKLSQIHATASGKIKVEVKVETGVASGTFSTKFVAFNSTATPNVIFPIIETVTVAAGVRVRITITNKDLQSQDVYSTICGHEI